MQSERAPAQTARTRQAGALSFGTTHALTLGRHAGARSPLSLGRRPARCRRHDGARSPLSRGPARLSQSSTTTYHGSYLHTYLCSTYSGLVASKLVRQKIIYNKILTTATIINNKNNWYMRPLASGQPDTVQNKKYIAIYCNIL